MGFNFIKWNIVWRFAYLVVCLVFAAIVFSIFVREPGINGYERAMFADMVYGKAHKPFVYRMLLPAAVRLTMAVIPSHVRRSLTESMGRNPIADKVFSKLRWEKEYAVEYGIALVLMFLSLLGFVFSIRYFFASVFSAPRIFGDVVSLVALLGLPPFFQNYSYLYDFPTLFLFTLSLALMVRARWRLFLPVFVITCLNKETAILLTLIFTIHFFNKEKLDRSLFGRLLLYQLAVFLLIKGALFLIFENNPGSFVEFHFVNHNLLRLEPYPLSTVLTWIAVATLIFYKWYDKPDFLRHGSWIIAPLFFLTLLFGYVDELRDYYEAYPIVVLLMTHTVGNVLGVEVKNSDGSG